MVAATSFLFLTKMVTRRLATSEDHIVTTLYPAPLCGHKVVMNKQSQEVVVGCLLEFQDLASSKVIFSIGTVL